MNLAHAYANALESLNTTQAVEQVIARMRLKGHLSLLPQGLNILERNDSATTAVLTVAKKEDANRYLTKVSTVGGDEKTARIVVDPRTVGGYMARSGNMFVDATFRCSLVSLYKKTLT